MGKTKKLLCQIVYVLRNFSLKEKAMFFLLAIIFVISSLSVIWKINDLFLVVIPANKGILTEGIIGTPRFINPVLAISDADRDMASLIYSGLLRSDGRGNLIPDLAEKFEVANDGLSYTFTLKQNLVWQDDEPLTVDDVIFTIKQAKNPDTKSSKRASWEGVEIEKVDERTVRFALKKTYAPFLENMTIGIIPQHLWKNAQSEQMILSDFNIKPVGSGPYKIKTINKNSSGIATSYELEANNNSAPGKPFIQDLIMKFYLSENDLLEAYQNGDIDSVSAISPQSAKQIKKDDSELKTLSLPRVFGVFFNQNNAKVFSQIEVRQALNLAVDKKKIIEDVFHGFGAILDSPIPPGVFGATSTPLASTTPNVDEIKNILKRNGWEFNEEAKVWIKKNKAKKEEMRLEFSLATSDVADLKQSAELLKSMWEAIGAKVNIKVFEIGDLNQNIIRPRKYDALLFGEIVGRDPDSFAFWHSSQRNDPGLNIAMYANIKVDKLLEEARTTPDETKRREKYEEFQKEVAKDIPAIFLFSPKFIYLMPNYLKGTEQTQNIIVPSERFSQVYKWYVKTDKVWKIFAR